MKLLTLLVLAILTVSCGKSRSSNSTGTYYSNTYSNAVHVVGSPLDAHRLLQVAASRGQVDRFHLSVFRLHNGVHLFRVIAINPYQYSIQ